MGPALYSASTSASTSTSTSTSGTGTRAAAASAPLVVTPIVATCLGDALPALGVGARSLGAAPLRLLFLGLPLG